MDKGKTYAERYNGNTDENGVLDSVMLSYNDWAKECKKHLDTKPHVKNRWKDSTFKKCYKEGMTPKQAVSLCWLASY